MDGIILRGDQMDRTIGRMITLLARKSQSYIAGALSKYDLTSAEQPFFMAILCREGATQEELTALVCVDKAATARAVKSLESKGFLIRVQDKQDRRQNRIYPTEKTKQMADAVKSELLRFNDLLTRGIDAQSLDLVYRSLLRMEENFKDLSGGRCAGSGQKGEYDEAGK